MGYEKKSQIQAVFYHGNQFVEIKLKNVMLSVAKHLFCARKIDSSVATLLQNDFFVQKLISVFFYFFKGVNSTSLTVYFR